MLVPVFVLLAVAVAVGIFCLVRHRSAKREAALAGVVSATAGRSSGGGSSRPMSLYFRNPNFGRARLSTGGSGGGEELKDVCVADFGAPPTSSSKKSDPSHHELHNPDFTSALLHASASNQDLRPRSPRYVDMVETGGGDEGRIRRCRTNPNLEGRGDDVPPFLAAPRATFTIDSRRSGDSYTSSSASPPESSSLEEDNDLAGVLEDGDGDCSDRARLIA